MRLSWDPALRKRWGNGETALGDPVEAGLGQTIGTGLWGQFLIYVVVILLHSKIRSILSFVILIIK